MCPSPLTVLDVAVIPGLDELWTKTLGDRRVSVAILDGPVDLSHPSFRGADLRRVETLIPQEADSGPASQHGTHVASVVFGQHDGPVKGLAPRCRGLIAPIFTDVVAGSPVPCSQIDLARAIVQVALAGANIINVSGGQFSPSGAAHPILADAIRNCARNGILIIAAAGNQGCDCLHIPGALPSVLAVGAMDAAGEPLPFSNWGRIYQSQGLLAPGAEIAGARAGGGTYKAGGTSFATPIVSGVAALLSSLMIQRGRKLDLGLVRQALLRSSRGCEYQKTADCRRLLAGRLNVPGATLMIASGESNMPDKVQDTSSPAQAEGIASSAEGSAAVSREVAGSLADPTTGVPPDGQRQANGLGRQMVASASLAPSACSCPGQAKSTRLVFALGQIGYDFGTEARRDSFMQNMQEPGASVPPNPYDPNQLLAHLDKNPWDAASLIWTLSLDATPIYAVQPSGPFAGEAYQRLRQFLRERLAEGVERVSVPGAIAGQVRLFNGQTVPTIEPEIRGMFSWTTRSLVDAVAGQPPAASTPASEQESHARKAAGVNDFLDRVYFELRNLGQTPQERAINYAATNAFNIEKVFENAMKEDMDLDTIEVEASPLCRPDSDCWDVKLFFFFPDRQVQTVRKAYRFTVDVSDVVPVAIGPVRSWFVR
jgi:cyanobactin maturation PatA/PatG family protease